MLSNFFTSLGWTRDDFRWTAAIVAAVIVGLASLGNTITDYGIPASWMPYIRLGALVVGLISAKMATSGLPGAKVILIGMLTIASAFGVSACLGVKAAALPSLPTLTATTDKELRDVEMYALQVLKSEVSLLNEASKTEDLVARSTPNFPPAVDKALRAGIADAATKSDTLAQDIVAGRIKTSAVLKQRVDPILKKLADLQALAKPQGHPTLMAALDIVANIAVQILMSGTGVGAMR